MVITPHLQITEIANNDTPLSIKLNSTIINKFSNKSTGNDIQYVSTMADNSGKDTSTNADKFSKFNSNHLSNKFIVIIDGINELDKFKSSTVIKKEINRCKPALSFYHCYSLPAGGITLHCRSKEDFNLVNTILRKLLFHEENY